MNKDENGGPAFPVADLSKTQCTGLSLRDYFAAKAMAEYMRENFTGSEEGYEWNEFELAEFAYTQADAMLVARKS